MTLPSCKVAILTLLAQHKGGVRSGWGGANLPEYGDPPRTKTTNFRKEVCLINQRAGRTIIKSDEGVDSWDEIDRATYPDGSWLYTLTVPLPEALEILRSKAIKPEKAESPCPEAPDATKGLLNAQQDKNQAAVALGKRSGEVRAAKAKGIKIGGRVIPWPVYRRELAQKKQGVLL